ncbi:Ran-binding protein 9 [Xylographa vitiligo]|nr:Ran-binding protein 9 [Xylographa vitiligo]
MPPSRSSYASVAAGTAAASPPSQTPPARSGTFSHLMNPAPPSPNHQQLPESQHRGYVPQEPSEDTGPVRIGTAVNAWGSANGMTHWSNQYSIAGVYGAHNNALPGSGGFFVPTYLRDSKYLERLEDAHRAKVLAQKETTVAHTNGHSASLSKNSSSVSLHKLAPSHRGMTYDIIEHQPAAVFDGPTPLPSKWLELDKYGGLEIVGDGLEVRYTGPLRTHDHEAAAARADHPMPSQCGIYYYEVTIISKGKDGMIGVGFSGQKVSLEKLPGWENDSWAYHGDDGMTFCCQLTGKKYGPTFTNQDVIGCGVNFLTGSAFFTKNGVFQGNAFRDIKDIKLYPSVGAKRPGAQLRVNFGQSPFIFDIDGMVACEKSRTMTAINSVNTKQLCPPLSEDALIKELVAQFLRHAGYVDTAKAFATETSSESNALNKGSDGHFEQFNIQEDLDAINRQQIRAAILEGDIDKALKRTNAYYPDVLRDNPRIHFRLRCRKFVEMMRESTELLSGSSEKRSKPPNGHAEEFFGQAMELDEPVANGEDWDRMETEEMDNSRKYEEILNETLRYAQELKYEYKDDPSKEVKNTLESIFAMFAYEDPRKSPTAAVIKNSGRIPVAEELNSAILVSLGKSSAAALERLCQQTEVLVGDISEHGGPGALINVKHDFLKL